MKVRKAVIPAAGLGTRFLPASKAQPKEMLPVVDKPAIQYVVEEAVRSGLDDILIITGRGKESIEDHFDRSWELETTLAEKGDIAKLEVVQAISELAQVHAVRQKSPLGLGHAVLAAERHVGDEPFAVLLGDDLIGEGDKLLAELVACYERHQASVVAVMEVEPQNIRFYGAVAPSDSPVEPDVHRVLDIVEKPDPAEAPSNLAVIGRYVLDPTIFQALHVTEPDAKGEIQLTDGLQRLARWAAGGGTAPPAAAGGHNGLLALTHRGTRYDIGNKDDYLRATVELACQREDLGPAFVAFLRDFVAGLDADAALGR